MDLTAAELIIHPVRLRILQSLVGSELTTQELGERLPEIPQSSLYRHLRLLHRGGVVEIVEKRLVQGIQEKVYTVTGRAHLSQEEMADLDVSDHLRYFTTYVLSLLQGFHDYLQSSEAADGKIEMRADYAGYTEAVLYASEAELDQFQQALNEALLPLREKAPAPERHRHKIAIITYPTGDDRERVA